MQENQIKQLTINNIKDEHICCAISDKKTKDGYNAKKEWLKSQFKNGYVFKKLDVRGKVFIEYVPAEKGWLPIKAKNYMLINCFWVSGKYKKQGYGKQLLQEAIKDAQNKNMSGLVAVVGNKKQPFMSDKKFYIKQGFKVCDTALPYFELLYKPFDEKSKAPKFKNLAKTGECDNKNGLAIYYTNSCPFTEYYVNTELVEIAKERNINLTITKFNNHKDAQNHFVPHTIYSVFYNGKFITQHILNKKSFDKFIK